jgi:hypothetical protein
MTPTRAAEEWVQRKYHWLRGNKMLRTILIIAGLAIIGLGVSGCKKSPDQTGTRTEGEVAGEPNESAAKTLAEYEAEAEKEITAENMQAELEKLEAEINRESRTERQPLAPPQGPEPPKDNQ